MLRSVSRNPDRGAWSAARHAVRKLLQRYRYETADEYARIRLIPVGSAGRRVRLTGRVDFGTEPYLVHIGSDVTIADGVAFVTHDGAVALARDELPKLNLFGKITIGNRVFIGIRTIVLPGVTIGDDTIIGAGSVVTKSIPPGSVAVGSPCRPVGSTTDYLERARRHGVEIGEDVLGGRRDAEIARAVSLRADETTGDL